MSQEEPVVPPKKKAKVEPLDRRGGLAGFIKNRKVDIQDECVTPEKPPESPTQILHRLISDPAANHNELCKTLRHFLPHVQLIEIEKTLFDIVSKYKSIDNETRLYGLLTFAKELSLLDQRQISVGHDIRIIRNSLFHKNHLVEKHHVQQIDNFWYELRSMTSENKSVAIKIKQLLETGPDKVLQVQKVAEEICEVAIFIDIEVILRKVLDWILKRDIDFAKKFTYPQFGENLTNRHAFYGLTSSNNRLAQSIRHLRFLNSIEKSIDYRNVVIHGQLDFKTSRKKTNDVYRSWILLINLPYAFRANCLVQRLEKLLRQLLISEGVKSEVAEKLWIERLAFRVCDEEKCMTLLAGSGVSRSDILWLIDFGKSIFRYELNPPLKTEVETLTRLCNGVEKALINPVFSLTHKPVIKSRESARKQAKQRFKHPKSRRFDDLDDFS